MCIIHLRVQCSDRFSEVLVDDVEYTELTIESIVGTALLEVFDTVRVESITVQHSPKRNDGESATAVPTAMTPPPTQSHSTIGFTATPIVTRPCSLGDDTSVR